ncbi:hypothetical protein [Microbacterium halotolerans]|uniref:hypothetical protein n=1 Tax=Microbacterium halotolerans TaxID=246613 RepID=UPI000E6A952B|nr:hypothetical protein [Microbacterium halotolerans]
MTKRDDRLRPIETWDVFWRGSFATTYDGVEYVIDVDYFDFSERIRLYRDGMLIDSRKSPARFDLDPATRVEATMSLYGMKHVDLINVQDGRRVPLQPRAGTGESWRAGLARKHPQANRWIGFVSWSVLVFAAVTQIPVLFNSTLAHLTGTPLPTLGLPVWANATLGIAGILAALDRALQLKHNKWLDD